MKIMETIKNCRIILDRMFKITVEPENERKEYAIYFNGKYFYINTDEDEEESTPQVTKMSKFHWLRLSPQQQYKLIDDLINH